jgi:hypothetical protein
MTDYRGKRRAKSALSRRTRAEKAAVRKIEREALKAAQQQWANFLDTCEQINRTGGKVERTVGYKEFVDGLKR